MTDDDIRANLAKQIEQEGRGILVDSPADGPPLLIVAKNYLRPEAFARIRQAWEQGWKRDAPGPQVVIIDGGFDLFQLINGEWKKLS
jgi:hypothetical protein